MNRDLLRQLCSMYILVHTSTQHSLVGAGLQALLCLAAAATLALCSLVVPPPPNTFSSNFAFLVHFYISVFFDPSVGIFKETLSGLAEHACFYLIPWQGSPVLIIWNTVRQNMLAFTLYPDRGPLCSSYLHCLHLFVTHPMQYGEVSEFSFKRILFPSVLSFPMYFCAHVLLSNVVLRCPVAIWQVVSRIAEKTAADVTLQFPQ